MSIMTAFWISALLCLSECVAGAPAGKGPRGKWGLNKIWNHAYELGHLPELSEPVRKPGQESSVAICATMKDENTTDVREWLLYYRCFFISVICLNKCCLYAQKC